MNGQFVVVGALIAIAVANEKVIAHPHGHADAAVVGLLFGGAAAYLVVQVWYLNFATGRVPLLRAAGVIALVLALAVLGVADAAPVIAIAAAAAMMTALAIAAAAGKRAAPARAS